MTELEKEIGNLRSGLKSVESVSHTDYLFHTIIMTWSSLPSYFFMCFVEFYFKGAGIPEETTAGARWQVCVRGEPVHYCGQLQLLRRGGHPDRSQRTGEFGESSCRIPAETCQRRRDSIAVIQRQRGWVLVSCFYTSCCSRQPPWGKWTAGGWSPLASCCCSIDPTLLKQHKPWLRIWCFFKSFWVIIREEKKSRIRSSPVFHFGQKTPVMWHVI